MELCEYPLSEGLLDCFKVYLGEPGKYPVFPVAVSPRFKLIPLPVPGTSAPSPIEETLLKRQSRRAFSQDAALTLRELSYILSYILNGLRMLPDAPDSEYSSRRAYPSGGARYPLEAYILPLRVEGLSSHVHHYHVRSHGLEELWEFSSADFKSCFGIDEWCLSSAAVIVLTCCHQRSFVKYRERSYRLALLDNKP